MAICQVTISAILTTRDRPSLLPDALASVAAQRVAPLEIRLADDGEAPVGQALHALSVLKLVVIRCEARRVASARNLAAREARGEVLAFLDDDDLWLPDHLAGFAEIFRDRSVKIAYRDAAIVLEEVDSAGVRLELGHRVIAREWDAELMSHDDFVPPSALAIRRDLFERLAGFDESFPHSEDWDLLLRAARVTRPRRVAGVTVEVRMRAEGHLSQEAGDERRACLSRLAERHGLPPLEIKTFWEVAPVVAATAGEKREIP